jgi:hypothetical protein
MTDGNLEFVQVIVSLFATVPPFAAILRYDERRLTGEQRSRAWPPSSRDAAVLGSFLFGLPYALTGLVVYFVRTRWSWRGALLGLAAAVGLFSLNIGAELAVSALVDSFGL